MKVYHSLFFTILFQFSLSFAHAQVANIPIEFNGTHMFIKIGAKMNDSLRFVFDTGVTGATIDSLTAENAGLSKINRRVVTVDGSGGSKRYEMALNQTLKVQNLEIKNLNLILANLSDLSSYSGFKLNGLIGYDLLKRYVTQVDLDSHNMLLFNCISEVNTAGYTKIPFEFSKNILIPRFPISITIANGEAFTGKVMFDTGNAFTLIVSTPFSKFHNFDSKLGKSVLADGRGMNATTQDLLADIKAMSFNGFDFGPMGIRLTVNEKAEPKDGYLGILGMGIIKRFNFIIDYANKLIYLKPNKSYKTEFMLESVKLKFVEENKIFLEKNKHKTGITTTLSGLQYRILKNGHGPIPSMKNKVSLAFEAKLINGQKLWSTYDTKRPWIHHLDKALPGVREAALMMPVGSKWEIYIPDYLAYGPDGYENVPGGSVVKYVLEVLAIDNP